LTFFFWPFIFQPLHSTLPPLLTYILDLPTN
jgi:hypothetical protein